MKMINLINPFCFLSSGKAEKIFTLLTASQKNFWDKYKWNELDWPVCLCCLDCSINHGKFALILQRATIDCGQSIVVDGKFGPKTFAALKACNPEKLTSAIVKHRKLYYEKIVARNPSQKIFLNGWLRRNNDMAKVAGLS